MIPNLLRVTIRLLSRDQSPQETREVEESLLPDQHRIIRVVSQNYGRMWQGDLVEETGWSASKMSRTLTEMESEGRIVRYQIGREKLVTLPRSSPSGPRHNPQQSNTDDPFGETAPEAESSVY